MTKVHITNLYGMAGDSTVILAQNAVTEIARSMGFREIGIYFYNITTDSPGERSKRLDGMPTSCQFIWICSTKQMLSSRHHSR